MPILPEETLHQLNYTVDSLSPGSNRLVICACDRCTEHFERKYRFAIPPLYCDKCNSQSYEPQVLHTHPPYISFFLR